jgi:hypothetical protein
MNLSFDMIPWMRDNLITGIHGYMSQNKKFWEELIAYFPLIRHGQHRKQCVNIGACVLVTAVTFLPNRCLVTYIYRHRLIGGFHEVRHCDCLRYHDMHTKFHKDWFKLSKVVKGGYTDSKEIT